ncbi:MAG TPA: hypothetical protein ENH10_01805 [Bacteroidetes bacterium]|nr:hypothetical protein [Bacteroidota bacterium]HEX03877.1 hypothetical protein [Bacteroidota bacterium]
MRNGFEVELTRVSAPGEAEVQFMEPAQYKLPESLRNIRLYEFEYDYNSRFPHIRIDDRPTQNEFFPPQNIDPDDEFSVDPETFRIFKTRRWYNITSNQDSVFTDYFLSIKFNLTYRHYSGFLGGRSVYEKVMPFAGSAFVYNDRWPTIKPPGQQEE